MQHFIEFMAMFNGTVFLVTIGFIALDVVTGYSQAIANKCVSSEKMRKGFWHKMGIVFVLILAGMVDICVQIGVGNQIGFATPIFECACAYIIVMELTSILENVCKLNPELANNAIMQIFDNAIHHDNKENK